MEGAQKAIADAEQNWAAPLISYLVRIDPQDRQARQIKADCLRHMGQRTPASVVRNWYRKQAVHMEGKADIAKSVINFANLDVMRQNPPGTFVRSLRFRLLPGKALNDGSARLTCDRAAFDDFTGMFP